MFTATTSSLNIQICSAALENARSAVTKKKVQDFARNFVLNFQDEPKDLHWDHNQVTVHPTVIYRCCLTKGCDELITEEIIHVTPDLKHDPLAVKKFEEDVEFQLRSKNISYEEKFIWMDQVPTQYKSCHVFEGIANSSTCITHHYYPVEKQSEWYKNYLNLQLRN